MFITVGKMVHLQKLVSRGADTVRRFLEKPNGNFCGIKQSSLFVLRKLSQKLHVFVKVNLQYSKSWWYSHQSCGPWRNNTGISSD